MVRKFGALYLEERGIPGSQPTNADYKIKFLNFDSLIFTMTPSFISFASLIRMSFFCLFAISWATPAACGGSQARGPIRAVAAGLCQSHSNMGSEVRLLMATPDP